MYPPAFSDAPRPAFLALESLGDNQEQRVKDARAILNTVLDIPTDISLSWKSPEDSLLAPQNNALYDVSGSNHIL